jgi:hypothetical protein
MTPAARVLASWRKRSPVQSGSPRFGAFFKRLGSGLGPEGSIKTIVPCQRRPVKREATWFAARC